MPPLEGETGEAPPAAEKASRFRGSGAIGGPARDRESPCRDGVGGTADAVPERCFPVPRPERSGKPVKKIV